MWWWLWWGFCFVAAESRFCSFVRRPTHLFCLHINFWHKVYLVHTYTHTSAFLFKSPAVFAFLGCFFCPSRWFSLNNASCPPSDYLQIVCPAPGLFYSFVRVFLLDRKAIQVYIHGCMQTHIHKYITNKTLNQGDQRGDYTTKKFYFYYTFSQT